MIQRTRREFIAEVAKGMVVASVGAGLASDVLPGPVLADAPETLSFGTLEPLVALMQETPPARLMPLLAERLRQGTELRTLVEAGALANARAFGGEDYVGFHTMMALSPAWHMSRELPEARRALPVLKVLHRNATRIQETGGRRNEVLRPVQPSAVPEGRVGGEVLRDSVRRRDVNEAERTFAGLCRGTPEEALNHLLIEVEDATEVHRVNLAYRAWDLLGIIGREQAHTLLRQSVRYCVRNETPNYAASARAVRELLPRVLDQHRLIGRPLGRRVAEDGWVDDFSRTLLRGTPEAAADAAGAALAEGMTPDAIGEAISLASNQLVLKDPGRTAAQAQPNKPVGSVHGDSIGVHASDSASAWRNLARVSDARHTVICLVLGAYQVCRDTGWQRTIIDRPSYPTPEARAAVQATEPAGLLRELDGAVRAGEQLRAAALAQAYVEGNHASRPIFDLLIGHALKDEGALHGEKYYRTVTEEYALTRPAFRGRQIVALARVVASAANHVTPGYTDTCRLMGVEA